MKIGGGESGQKKEGGGGKRYHFVSKENKHIKCVDVYLKNALKLQASLILKFFRG